MKIGIITFHNVINYGAVLQCFALQRKLQDMGNDVEVIDYRNHKFEREYKPFYISEKNIRKILYAFKAFPERLRRKKKFNEFCCNYLKLSQREYNLNNINETNEKYNLFITGSDQVWNYELTDYDENYFLKFVKNKGKVSYAASIGLSSFNEEAKLLFKDMIDEFDYISVREKKAQKILKEFIDKEVEINIDPVLLLNEKDLIELYKNEKKIQEDYILVYKINQSETYNLAKKISSHYNMKVIVIQPDKHCKLRCTKYRAASPTKYVSLFHDAKYIVTDSFHGTVFSILFEKKFIYCPDKSINNRNSRIYDMLTILSLENRCLKENQDVEYINNYIDYSNVKILLEKQRKNTEEYLRKITG